MTSAENRTFPGHTGLPFRSCLSLLHEIYQPSTYLEIGVREGKSLALAQCASIGVDPRLQIKCDVHGSKPSLTLVQTTSDEFFATDDPRKILGAPIDLAFIDGLHLVEQVLKDFINTERCCTARSAIVLHDCLPTDPYMTVRDQTATEIRSQSRNPGWWTGDVWKMVPLLTRYRPDLKLELFNAPPTGLLLVTRLDPHSRVLSENAARILADFSAREDDEKQLADFVANAVVTDTKALEERALQVRSAGGGTTPK